MKKLSLLILLIFVLVFPSHAAPQEMRGVWVSSVYNLDYPSSPGLSSVQLAEEADKVIEKAESSGLTDIFLQVRPTCDSLYKSSIFPSSAYVCTNQGDAFPDDFDALEYFITKGKEAGIRIHAWINPYRITRGGFPSKEDALASLSISNPAKKLSDHIVFHSDGNIYFDPSSEEVRNLILEGIMEIVNNYDIAGIHLDDYFYPSADFDDESAYNALKTTDESLHAFRTRQVDSLIYLLYDTVKAADPDCLFGISPFGVWANKESNPLGSDTSSSQSYYDHYADTLKWVKEEKVDYIMPQLYWNIGNAEADYDTLLKWWSGAVSGTSVKLYTGLAAYRIPDNELGYTTDEIISQINHNISSENCSGFCIFRLNSIDESLSDILNSYSSSAPLYIAVSSDDFQTDMPRFRFYGTSQNPLFINGQTVNTSVNGYFSISVPLFYGTNSFEFTSGNSIRTINIYRNYTAKSDITYYSFTKPSDSGYITATFSACRLNGSFYGSFHPHDVVQQYNSENSFTVTVSKDNSNVYNEASTSDGAIAILMQNTKWNVTASKGEFYYLEDLGWIKRENCSISSKNIKADKKIESISQTENEGETIVSFNHASNISIAITEDENGFSLHFNGISDLPTMPDFIKNGSIILNSHGLVYSFTPSKNTDISGFEIVRTSIGSDVIFHKKPDLTDEAAPLSGISFLLDAGHGGDQPGALSCDPNIREKDINLIYTSALGEKLSSLGASVEYTRTEDNDISLDKRYMMASSSPAIFISMHSDSLSNSSPVEEMSGVSLHVNNRHSIQLAEFISENMDDIAVNYISESSNLYMAKPKNTYSILIENQFVSAPASLELLLSEEYKSKFIECLCRALCDFFEE